MIKLIEIDDFKVADAKFPLDMTLAFFNANALKQFEIHSRVTFNVFVT